MDGARSKDQEATPYMVVETGHGGSEEDLQEVRRKKYFSCVDSTASTHQRPLLICLW